MSDAVNSLLARGELPPEMTGALERVRDFPPAVFVIGSLLVALVIFPDLLDARRAARAWRSSRRPPPPPPPGTVEILPPE